jgi:hypothetical protein
MFVHMLMTRDWPQSRHERDQSVAKGPFEAHFYGLDPLAAFGDIAPIVREISMAQGRRIVWVNVITVISAAILIGAEVFGAAFAGSWAIATLFDLGSFGARVLDIIFVFCGIAIMAQFIRNAHLIEPFTARS